MKVPHDLLSPDALDNLIAEYCLRDWGLNDTETPLAERKHAVRQALLRGDLLVFFSEEDETARLISSRPSP